MTQLNNLQQCVKYMENSLRFNMNMYTKRPLTEAERQQLLTWVAEYKQLMEHMQATSYREDLVSDLLSRMTL